MQLLKKILPILLLLVTAVCSFSSHAARLREFGSQKNVYVTEWSKLKHKAELGDPEALFVLGNFYFEPPEGSGFRRNYKKAAELYFQASLRKNPAAQYNIAIMLHRGLGFKANVVESYVWFYLASVNESPVAKRINRKTAEIVVQLKTELKPDQLLEAERLIESYQNIMKTKRYRDAKLPD
ncbi:tetratricopeptide repeat protein [Aliikangiella coralliicola]|uniref:Sel1 repeat family protein n=1 Tax=Aliikangiella coralliicola TaxID=2592383 RepID=A0A545UFE4_9GAMM|nr:tetratricopeptide repeat protein [Aliikangiella coralliicola]TQV88187.1 sel1 repeat family protein [Aliikangiella coralliicola]